MYTVTQLASDDPVQIVEVRRGIAELDVPEEFTPQQSFDFTIPFVDQQMVSWVVYGGRDERSVLILAEFNREMTTASNLQELIAKLDESLAQWGSSRDDIEVEESEKLTLEIRGEPAEFLLGRGRPSQRPPLDNKPAESELGDGELGEREPAERDPPVVDEDREYWMVTGQFAGAEGPSALLMIVDTETFDRQRIIDLIESIR
jgi:hypothetical protein